MFSAGLTSCPVVKRLDSTEKPIKQKGTASLAEARLILAKRQVRLVWVVWAHTGQLTETAKEPNRIDRLSPRKKGKRSSVVLSRSLPSFCHVHLKAVLEPTSSSSTVWTPAANAVQKHSSRIHDKSFEIYELFVCHSHGPTPKSLSQRDMRAIHPSLTHPCPLSISPGLGTQIVSLRADSAELVDGLDKRSRQLPPLVVVFFWGEGVATDHSGPTSSFQ